MGYRNDRVTRRGVAGGIGAAVFAAGLAAAPVTGNRAERRADQDRL